MKVQGEGRNEKKKQEERVCWVREMEKNNQREEIGNECELEMKKNVNKVESIR